MAGKNNFYPYGESSTNILNNSEYQTDQERTAGAARGAIARSKIYNKALRQGAAGAYAVADLVAAAGKDADDASAATLAENFRAAVSYQARAFVASAVNISGGLATATVDELATTAKDDLPALFSLAMVLDQSLPAGTSIKIASSLPDTDLTFPIYSGGEVLEDDVITAGAISLMIDTIGGKAFFRAGGMGKLPSDLAPLCPNFKVERNGGKIKVSADKIQLNSLTSMVSGGVWAWGKTRPVKPTGENTKLWTRAELITTGKPYDGLYLGDVTPSDGVTETPIYLPENDSGKVKLVPFIILSTDYLGGVYVMRQKGNKDWVGKYGNNVTYENSESDVWTKSYLNSILDKGIVEKLLECEIHVFEQGTIKRKCWIPSYGELYSDFTDSGNTFMPYFNSNSRRALIKQDDGNPLAYWTRTFYNLSSVRIVNHDGSGYFQSASNKTAAYRPSFVLPKDFKVQKRPDGSYTVWNEQGLMTLADVEPSTGSQKVAFNIPETIKSGLATKYAEFVYGMKEYNGSPGGLFTRNDNGFASGKMYGALWTQTDAYNVLTQYATYEPSSLTLADRCLHSSIRKILMSVSVKSTDNGGSIHDNEVKCLLLSTREVNDGTYETGTPIPYYSVQANRIMKDASGVAAEAWLRDAPSSPSYQFRFIGQDGQIGTKVGGSTLEIVPSICIPLDTPIRQLADGSYDLVPEDPALSAQSISTMADEEEVPLEIELDWPESDPLIARQWVYNEKGIYQTMLLGGVASTEDAPAFELPVFTGNHAIFGDETAGRIELYESGTLTLYPGTYDFFLVGGGSGSPQPVGKTSSVWGGSGGGSGGYTFTEKGFVVDRELNSPVIIGAGGVVKTAGANTSIDLVEKTITANGGTNQFAPGADGDDYDTPSMRNGYSGGSGGASMSGQNGPRADGGSNGSNGVSSKQGRGTWDGGLGQGTTTRAFGEELGTLYAGGGGGASYGDATPGLGGAGGGGNAGTNVSGHLRGSDGTANTGGGGGGGKGGMNGGEQNGSFGGSGIIIVRWNNAG